MGLVMLYQGLAFGKPSGSTGPVSSNNPNFVNGLSLDFFIAYQF